MKMKNKGYSFVELILTMAIFSIIMLAIILMMRTSLVSYKDGLFETTLQEEAQITANQVSDFLVDATAIKTNNPGGGIYSFKSPEGDFTLKYVADTETDADGNNVVVGGKLYYNKGNGDQLLSDKVISFKLDGLEQRKATAPGVDADKAVYDNQVTVKVGLKFQDRTYSADKITYFRNNIENNSSDGSNDYDPFDVGNSTTTPTPSPSSDKETATVLRYAALDLSAQYDIVSDASISQTGNKANESFNLIVDGGDGTQKNTTIKSAPTGITMGDVHWYKIELKTPDDFGFTTSLLGDENYYVKGKNSKGEVVTINLHVDPVKVDTFKAADGTEINGIYEDFDELSITNAGYPTNVKVYGIDFSGAVAKKEIKYDLSLKKNGVTLGSFSDEKMNNVDLLNSNGACKSLGPQISMGVYPDTNTGGLVIRSDNGKRGDTIEGQLDNTDGNQDLYITIKMKGSTGTYSTILDLHYKYYMVGNTYENLSR